MASKCDDCPEYEEYGGSGQGRCHRYFRPVTGDYYCPSYGESAHSGRTNCPSCGKARTLKDGFIFASGKTLPRLMCKECGTKWLVRQNYNTKKKSEGNVEQPKEPIKEPIRERTRFDELELV